MKKIFPYLLVILTLSLFICIPFFRSGFFPTHDGEWAVVRLGAMHRSFIDKHIPARWAGNQNFGFGYPLFEFTYPFPYYLGEAFKLGGLGLISSVKAVFVSSVLLSGVSMFLLAKEFFGNMGGLVSSLFYIYAPYRLVNLYVRGSIGESLSLAIFPILFLLLYKIYKKNSLLYSGLFSLLFGVLLLTHNVTALVFTPFLGAFGLFLLVKHKNKRQFFKTLLLSFSLGILLSSFFLIPALAEKSNIYLSQARISDIKDHFVSFDKLIIPSWDYGAYGTLDSFSPQIGWVHLISLVLALVIIFLTRKNKFIFKTSLFFLVSFLILIFLMLPDSFFFWNNFPLFSDVDFPWRLLTPLIFFMSFLIGAVALNTRSAAAGLVLAALAIWFNFSYAAPKSYIETADSYYFTNDATTTSKDELMPLWVKEKPVKRPEEKVQVISGDAKVNIVKSSSIETSFEVTAKDESILWLNTIYYPGWVLNVNNQPIVFNYANPMGIMEFKVPPGISMVKAAFTETPLRIFSNIISLGSLFLILLLIFSSRFKSR